MGRAYARAFLAEGARVVATDRSWGDVDDFKQELENSGNALVTEFDVTDTAQIARARGATMDRFGRVDVLINNAAMRQRDLYRPSGAAAVLDTTDEDWVRMYAVNVVGVVKVTRQFIQPMIEQRRGSIINVSAAGSAPIELGDGVWSGRHPTIRNEPYEASKAALTNLTFYLAEEVKQYNIAVNVIFPAGTRTTGSDELHAARQALGFGAASLLKPEHVVPLALYLAQQDALGETGRAIDPVRWNELHGFGGIEAWLHETAAIGR
jgi:1,1a-dihydroxy-1-hydro-9-fluorenone dehydrogenase